METIRRLLQNNPGLLKFGSATPAKRERRHRYEQSIEDSFDKLEDIAREVQAMVMKLPHWCMDAGDRVFEFGKAAMEEYALNLSEIGRLFNEVLHKWSRGPLLGFLAAGASHEIIQDHDVLLLDLTKYSGAISGLGYKHPRGKLELVGDRAFYIGAKMTGGEILLRGHAANHVGKYLNGGEIIIEGNAGNWIGQQMQGGLITIKGSGGDIIGKGMTGGEIIIEGSAGGWLADGMKSGVIRVRGEYGPIDEGRSGGEVFAWCGDEWKVAPRSSSI